MGKLAQYAIYLAPPFQQNPVYWGGQVVQGTVILDLTDTMKMRGIHLQCVGEARVHWSERHSTGSGKNRRTTTRHYRNYESYFNFSIILFGKPQGQMSGDNPELPAGHYEYPFSFQLPPSLPPSYESFTGKVRYYLKATIDKPWKLDHEVTRPFTVLHNMDLNMMPQCRLGMNERDQKMICCLCCESGPITLDAQLDRSGFVPGEFLFMNIKLGNNTARRICSVNVKLCQAVLYHATSKTKRLYHTLVELPLEGCGPNSSRDYPNIQLQVPGTPASELAGCSIIDIQYFIQVTADPSGPALDLDVNAPITIGTTPMADSYAYYLSKTQQAAQYGFGAEASAPAPPMELPPPSYNELYSTEGDASDSEDEKKEVNSYGETNWAPRYQYYTYGPPLQPSAPGFVNDSKL